ncbi:MAG TPA: hypothetical protein PLU22_17040 [Polyangiaceae bacterium]|nr:hypothetical protein [Polyangiaceae bacterium]
MSFNDDPSLWRPIARLGSLRTRDGAAGPTVTCSRDPHEDLLILKVRGRARMDDLTDAQERALDHGLVELLLWDVIESDLSGLSLDQLDELVTSVLTGPWAPRRWAIVTARGASMAATSVIETLASELGEGGRVMGFRELTAALEWLGVRESPTVPAPPPDELLRR